MTPAVEPPQKHEHLASPGGGRKPPAVELGTEGAALSRAETSDVAAKDLGAAGVGNDGPLEHAQQGRLARAVHTDHPDDRARLRLEVDSPQRLHRAKRHPHTLDPHRYRHAHPSSTTRSMGAPKSDSKRSKTAARSAGVAG